MIILKDVLRGAVELINNKKENSLYIEQTASKMTVLLNQHLSKIISIKKE